MHVFCADIVVESKFEMNFGLSNYWLDAAAFVSPSKENTRASRLLRPRFIGFASQLTEIN